MRRWLAITTSAVGLLAGCSGSDHQLGRLATGGSTGQAGADAATDGVNPATGTGGTVGVGGNPTTGTGGGSGGAMVDAPVGLDAPFGGGAVPGTGGTFGSGGRIGTGGSLATGGAGGASNTGGNTSTSNKCPALPSCNWCHGTEMTDGAGCVVGWRCANGIDPCHASPCTSASCQTGYTCGADMLCWPNGAGGSGGSTGTGGMGGGGAAGKGGTWGVRCGLGTCNAGDACCVAQSSSTQGCTTATGATCTSGFLVTCDGPEDCGTGQNCCMPSGTNTQNACVAGECLSGLRLCHVTADCPQGQSCCEATSFGYSHSRCVVGASCS